MEIENILKADFLNWEKGVLFAANLVLFSQEEEFGHDGEEEDEDDDEEEGVFKVFYQLLTSGFWDKDTNERM